MTTKVELPSCPICRRHRVELRSTGTSDVNIIACPSCGAYSIDGTSTAVLTAAAEPDERTAAVRTHAIRRMHESQTTPSVNLERLASIDKRRFLPLPGEQVDNLLRLLGERSPFSGRFVTVPP